jgi:glycerophosphoryl diester phosphodiesterase
VADELIQVIASCGIHDGVPPNTLAAFEAAIQAGCDMTETDFRRRAGGVIECCRGRLGVDFELKEDGLEEDILAALASRPGAGRLARRDG